LDSVVYSTTIIKSGHYFSLVFHASTAHVGWHALYLELATDISRVSPINVEGDIILVSYSSLHPVRKIEISCVYPKEKEAQKGGSHKFVETSVLKNGGYTKDGHLLIEARITVSP
jgi:hypothetical protein